MEDRDITGQVDGKIWHRNPAQAPRNGIIASLMHSGAGINNGRLRRFIHATFDYNGSKVIAADHLGGIYVFDLMKNRYMLVQNCGQSCTAIASGLKRPREYLVGLADSSVKCYTTDNKELISWMRGHESAVHSISVHSSGRHAITTSRDTAQLWNLDTFERTRKLNVKTEVPLQKVFYLPASDTILTCFTDDSIFGWESENFEWKFKLEAGSQLSLGYRAFAATRDSKILVCAGRSNLLHVYSLETNKLTQVIKMPKEVLSVKQIEFLSDKFDARSSKILGVLSQDGVARFVDVNSCQVIFELRSPEDNDKLTSICLSSEGGDFIAGTSEAGRFIIYNLKLLCPDFHKAPGPMVKVVKDIWKRKSFPSQTSTTISRSASRPIAGSISTGRIKGKRIKRDKDEVQQEEGVLPNGLSFIKLRRVLRWRGEYPDQYRLFIWRSILQIPENQTAFDSLLQKGNHLAYAAIEEKFPVKSGRLLRVMQRVLSCLAHWSAIFSELEYLPLIAFPFIKLFQNNHLICFEVIATVLVNWCQHWFEFFPNPPINVLSMIENLLSHHDKPLLRHFVKYEVTTQIYAWPLLQTFMSEVLTRDEWMRMFDHVFSNHSSFLLHCVVAYCVCSRSALLKTKETEDFKYFFHHRNSLDIGAVINEAYRMAESTPENINPAANLNAFEPLSYGETYPIFNKYPKFIVDYQAQERERIRKDELQYLKEKHVAQELTEQMEERKLQEDAWYRRKEVLREAEEQRKQLLQEEDRKLVEQRKKLTSMKRELRVRELQLLDKSRMRFVDHQQTMKQMEIKRLEEELRRKARLRDEETAAAVEDVEIKGLELEAQRAALEQEMAREQEVVQDTVKNDLNKRRRLEELEERTKSEIKDIAPDYRQTRVLQQNLANAELRHNALRHRTEATNRLLQGDIEREKALACSLSRNIEHLKQQKDINGRLKAMRQEKDQDVFAAQAQLRRLERIQQEGDERRAMMLNGVDIGENYQKMKESEVKVDDHLRRLRHECNDMDFIADTSHNSDRMTVVPNSCCLQEIPSESPRWTLNRRRGNLDAEERRLMDEVHSLREKMVASRSSKIRT